MAGIGAIASLLGTVVSVAGTMAAANQQQQAANWQALEYERQGKAEQAAAQSQAEQLERRKRLAQSTLQATAAASGFSATDPTALDITGEIARYGTMQSQMAMYGGADRRAGLESQATLARLSGQAAATGARGKAIGTLISGLGGLAKYGGGGGTTTAAPNFYGWG
jgi:hypothetical protein